jgi:hypothetical protein
MSRRCAISLLLRFGSVCIRFATLSFNGRVQVVAEISGRRRCDDDGRVKWRLSGTVLRPGDSVHDALKGRQGSGPGRFTCVRQAGQRRRLLVQLGDGAGDLLGPVVLAGSGQRLDQTGQRPACS